MAAQHTPEEWKVVGPDPASRNPNMGLWSVEGRNNVANDCTLHDARLISAAKEMLGALREAEGILDYYANGRTSFAGEGSPASTLAKVQAALSKAIPSSSKGGE